MPMPEPSERMASLPVGVVVERHSLDNPWQDHEWVSVDVVPGAGPVEEWLELGRGDGWVRYLIGSAPLELHRRETEAYKVNLSRDQPLIYVLLRSDEDPDARHEIKLFLVTASPYEAQDYLDADGNILHSVPMPADMIAWIEAFIDKHHVDEPFYKRQRQRYDPNDAGFGVKPGSGGDKGGNGIG
jgi:Protein of unknown function (DUF3305)